jgi:hypothetical protein
MDRNERTLLTPDLPPLVEVPDTQIPSGHPAHEPKGRVEPDVTEETIASDAAD